MEILQREEHKALSHSLGCGWCDSCSFSQVLLVALICGFIGLGGDLVLFCHLDLGFSSVQQDKIYPMPKGVTASIKHVDVWKTNKQKNSSQIKTMHVIGMS